MAQALILDSEALHALARVSQRGVLAGRARSILQVAHDEGALVRVPAAVLAEVCRGGAFDAPVNRLLNGRGILIDLEGRIARRAGALLGRAEVDSAHAVDAFVVATAAEFAATVIATGDPTGLSRLSSGIPHVRVFGI